MNQPNRFLKSFRWLLVATIFIAGCAASEKKPLEVGSTEQSLSVALAEERGEGQNEIPNAPRPSNASLGSETPDTRPAENSAVAAAEEDTEDFPNPIELLAAFGRTIGIVPPLDVDDTEYSVAAVEPAQSRAIEETTNAAATIRSANSDSRALAAERIGPVNPAYAANLQGARSSTVDQAQQTQQTLSSESRQENPTGERTTKQQFAELQQQARDVRNNVQGRRDTIEFLAAEQAFNNGNYTTAKQGLILLLRRNSQHREARLLMIDLCLRNADYSTGTAHGELIAQYFPKDPESHHALGLVLDAGGRLKDAIASYKKAVDLAPKNELYMSAYYTALDQFNRQNGKQPGKMIVMRKTIGPRPEKTFFSGPVEPQRVIAADPSVGSIDQLPPMVAPTLPLQAPAQVQPLPQQTVIPDSSQTIRHMPPVQVTERWSLNSQSAQANSSAQAVQATSATTASRITHTHSAPVASLLERGKAELRAGRPDVGLIFFRQALDLQPMNEHILINAGAAALRLDHPGVVLDLIEPNLGRFPESVPIRHIFGMSHYHRGDYSRAEAVFIESVSLDKTNALSYALLGYASAALGKMETASWSRQRALELDPTIATPLQANRPSPSTPAGSVIR